PRRQHSLSVPPAVRLRARVLRPGSTTPAEAASPLRRPSSSRRGSATGPPRRRRPRASAPAMHGTLAYTGMQVLIPFVAYAADSVDDETRAGYPTERDARLRALR